jgi:hypothetical protein
MRRRLSSSINNVVSNMRLEGAMEILPQVVFVVSGLKGESYEEKLEELEDRRHQADMLQTFKIVRGIDRVDHNTWFQLAAETGRATRSADDPPKLETEGSKVGGEKALLLLFSNRVIEAWNLKPSSEKCKNSERAYKQHI